MILDFKRIENNAFLCRYVLFRGKGVEKEFSSKKISDTY